MVGHVTEVLPPPPPGVYDLYRGQRAELSGGQLRRRRAQLPALPPLPPLGCISADEVRMCGGVRCSCMCFFAGAPAVCVSHCFPSAGLHPFTKCAALADLLGICLLPFTILPFTTFYLSLTDLQVLAQFGALQGQRARARIRLSCDDEGELRGQWQQCDGNPPVER